MQTVFPSYFYDFRCTADKCIDTCCAGWEVEIDKSTAEKYKTIDGEIGKKIRDKMSNCGNEYIFPLENGKCPFLNNDNLCEIQLCKGEKQLCVTCDMFPRYFDDYFDIRETGLGMGCPEAVKIILNSRNISLNKKVLSDDSMYNALSDLRDDFFEVLDDKTLTFKERIATVLLIAGDFQTKLDGIDYNSKSSKCGFDKCIDVLGDMEYIDINRKEYYLSLKNKTIPTVSYNEDFIAIMKYYIMRYLMESVYDLDVLTRIKYGVFACIVIGRIYSDHNNPDFDERVNILYGYSREIEYSPVNMDILDDELYEHFSIKSLIKLL